MDRRGFLAGIGGTLMATIAGCFGGTAAADCEQNLQTEAADAEDRFLDEGETPESDGAVEFLTTVAEVTGGRTGFDGDEDTWRIRFGETDALWMIEYYGDVASGNDRFREEIAALATAFASHRPDGVSLKATAIHECTTATWHVCADTAEAYEQGDLDRETFVERVHETAESENNC